MNRYFFLSAMLLLSVLTSCSDKDEDIKGSVDQKSVIMKSEKGKKLLISDSILNKSQYLNETKDKENVISRESAIQETIDPTKPDRPK